MLLHSNRLFVIIPAAGLGTRFSDNGEAVKQHVSLLGQTILERSVAPFLNHPSVHKISIVLSREDREIDQLRGRYQGTICEVVPLGGSSRASTVLNALTQLEEEVSDDDWILVHDAARPLISRDLIDRLIDVVKETDVGGLLACQASDTVKLSTSHSRVTKTLDRENLWLAQTPQMFRYRILRDALGSSVGDHSITDESSAVEARGFSPLLVASDATNFKITQPSDLEMARVILKQRAGEAN